MILRFLNHYHGSSDNLLGGNFRDIQNPLAYDEGNTIFSTEGRAQNILENEMFILPWNDLSVIKDFVLRHKNEIGAIIMELVMLNGGGETVQPEYLKKVRELCTKYNIVLIFDEIITGIRMGLGGAQKMYGITPDLTIYGKSISNGYMPVSILMGKREIMQQYETGSVVHGGTYNGYALGMVTVNSTIDILMESNYYKHILNIGNMLISIIKDEASKLGLPIFIKGHETCSVIHISSYETDQNKNTDNINPFFDGIFRTCFASHGILLAPVSRLFPHLGICDDDSEFFKKMQRELYRMFKILLRGYVDKMKILMLCLLINDFQKNNFLY